MKYFYWIGISLIIILGVSGIYFYMALQKLNYSYKIEGYSISDIKLTEGTATLSIRIKVILNSPFFFPVPVNFLYYEIYYKDNILGKSTNTSGFSIKAKPDVTEIAQSVDIFINKTNIEIAKKYITKTPIPLKVRVIVNVFGFNIDLKEINLTL